MTGEAETRGSDSLIFPDKQRGWQSFLSGPLQVATKASWLPVGLSPPRDFHHSSWRQFFHQKAGRLKEGKVNESSE